MTHEIVILGVLISILFYECTRISPGGIVVPAYLALYLRSPARLLSILALMVVTFFCLKLLSRFLILYGKRKFAVAVILSFLLGSGLGLLSFLPFDISIVGSLIPGIAAADFERQGFFKTLLAIIAVVGILALLMLWQGVL